MILKKTPSLTLRLTIAYTFSTLALVLLVTSYLYWSLVQALEYREQKFFLSRIEALRSLIARNDEGASLRFRVEKEWPARTPETFYVRLIDEAGKTIAESPGGAGIFEQSRLLTLSVQNLIKLKPASETIRFEGQVFRSVLSALDSGGKKYAVQIVLDRSEDDALLNDYRNRLFLVLSISILGCGLLCFQIARRGLRPIDAMARTTSSITSSNLDEKIQTEQMPAELAHLAETFNSMLDRLKEYFDRLQRFSADIAHELRTPINNISGELQVALGKERPAQYYKDAIGSSLEECSRLSQIIDSLLLLAHTENPRIHLSKERINLRKELEAAFEFYEAAASEKGISCTLEVEAEIFLRAERTLFNRAVGNLLSNAIKNTGQGGQIKVSADRKESKIWISVEDTGYGIPSEHLRFLFDRFYRVDASRTQDSGGSGLGLAIVKSVASIHGGDVEVKSEVGVGTRVALALPAP